MVNILKGFSLLNCLECFIFKQAISRKFKENRIEEKNCQRS